MESILLGRGTSIVAEQASGWKAAMEAYPASAAARLAFMTPLHHQIRNFVVRELPREGRPLSVERISRDLGLDREETARLLGDLEKHLFFLVRDSSGGVVWAYPVTAEPTPHRLEFSTGERIFAA